MPEPDFEATADAFSLLSDPIRVEILTALWQQESTPVPYSTLRQAVGMRDSGRFSYHLSKLTDHFVEKHEDGYGLRPAGMVVLNAIYAGSYVDAPTRENLDVEGQCPTCGSALVGQYDEGVFVVDCRDCGDQVFSLSFPPKGVTLRDDEAELLEAVSLHARAHVRQIANGLCAFCGGDMDATLELDADTSLPVSILVRNECGNCGVTNRTSVGFSVLGHPAVAGFLYEHGVPHDAPPWRFHWCLSDDPVTVVDDDPPRAQVDITVDDETLTVALNERGNVEATTRAHAE